VLSGRGRLQVGDHAHELEPNMGAYVVSGEEHELENRGPEELVVVVVEAPLEKVAAIDPGRRTVKYPDRPALEAGADREFRYLVNQDVGCLDVTQFVGRDPAGTLADAAIPTTRSSMSSMEKERPVTTAVGSRGGIGRAGWSPARCR
jgi:Cupin domain